MSVEGDMRKNAVFFDLDDTLINTAQASSMACFSVKWLLENEALHIIPKDRAPAVIKAYNELILDTPNDAYKSQSPKTIRTGLWAKALWENSPLSSTRKSLPGSDEAYGSILHDVAKALYSRWHITRLTHLRYIEPGTIDILLTLRKKYKLVLITNGCSAIQREKIQHIAAEKLFDHVIVSGEEPHDKPHTSIFLKACELCNASPDKCVMIGDNINTDILGANRTDLLAAILFRLTPCYEDFVQVSLKEIGFTVINEATSNFIASTIAEIPSLLEKIFEGRQQSSFPTSTS